MIGPATPTIIRAFFLDNLKLLGRFTARSIPRLSLYEPAMVFRA